MGDIGGGGDKIDSIWSQVVIVGLKTGVWYDLGEKSGEEALIASWVGMMGCGMSWGL